MATAALPALGGAADADRYKYKYIIAITVSLASVLELLDTSIVNVAIPHMMGNLGATLDEIAWVSTGYIVANVIILPITGWLSAYFGRRRYFAGSIAIFVISSFFCGNAHSLIAGVLADHPGVGGRRAALDLAGDPVRSVSARGVRHRDGDLRRGRDGGADPGSDARRLHHGRVRLAVDLLHQHPHRHAGAGAVAQLHPELAVPGEGGARRLRRPAAACGRHRHAPGHARARRAARLVRLARGHHVRRDQRAVAHHLRVARAHDGSSRRGPADPEEPPAGRGRRVRWCARGLSLRHGVRAARLPAEPPELHGGADRFRDPSRGARERVHDGHDGPHPGKDREPPV